MKMIQELDVAQTSAARVWLHHLKVAKIADTYDINGLERVAIASFHKLARPHWDDAVYVEVALQCSKSRFPRSVEKAMARQACQHMATLKDNEAFTSCIFLKHMGDFLFISCAEAFQKEHDLSERLFKDIKDVLAPGRCIKASCRASFPQDLKINRGSGAGRQNYKFQCRACNTLNTLPEAAPAPAPQSAPESAPEPDTVMQEERENAGDGSCNDAGDRQNTPEAEEEASERPQQAQKIRQENASENEANQFTGGSSRSRGLAGSSPMGETDQRAPVGDRGGSQNEGRDTGEDTRSRSRHYRSRRTTRITHRITTPSAPRPSTPTPGTARPSTPRSTPSTPRSILRSTPRTAPRTTAPSSGRQRRLASKMYESSGRDGMKKIVVGLKPKDRGRSESSEIHVDSREDGMPVGTLDPDMDENRGRSNRRDKRVRFADRLEQEINPDDSYRRRERREETARLSDQKARRKKKKKSGILQRFFAGLGR
mgnify:CR=1 FL=1